MNERLTVLEAAEYLGIEPMNVALLVVAGRLPHARQGGRIMLATPDLDDLLVGADA